MTGQITTWNAPAIRLDNPGVTLPSIPISVVARDDENGTNSALQQYCISEQPALWSTFVEEPAISSLGTCVSATVACASWPAFPGSKQAGDAVLASYEVANTADVGYITALESNYAINLDKPVASMKNASGEYVQPVPLNVESALVYASQGTDGSQILDFSGAGPNVYNPSMYSYILVPTELGPNLSAPQATALSAFINYALTIGQDPSPTGYAPLSRSLEQLGLNEIANDVPDAVPLTSEEDTVLTCSALTPEDVAAGATSPTCTPSNALPEAPSVPLFALLAVGLLAGWIGFRRRGSSNRRTLVG